MADGAENTKNDGTRGQAKLDDQTTAAAKNKKQSVLETHGYTIGRSLGSGAYATVKVTIAKTIILLFHPAAGWRSRRAFNTLLRPSTVSADYARDGVPLKVSSRPPTNRPPVPDPRIVSGIFFYFIFFFLVSSTTS
jgi:hypothetical protein